MWQRPVKQLALSLYRQSLREPQGDGERALPVYSSISTDFRENTGNVRASLVAQMVKITAPAVQEAQAQPLDWDDSLEEGKATHSNILAWRNPWTEEPGGLDWG